MTYEEETTLANATLAASGYAGAVAQAMVAIQEPFAEGLRRFGDVVAIIFLGDEPDSIRAAGFIGERVAAIARLRAELARDQAKHASRDAETNAQHVASHEDLVARLEARDPGGAIVVAYGLTCKAIVPIRFSPKSKA